jgi:hypothetical protein
MMDLLLYNYFNDMSQEGYELQLVARPGNSE